MKNHLFHFGFLFATMLLLVACGDDDADPVDEHEEELITTVRLTFTEGDQTFSADWQDADGDGALAPVVDEIELEAGKTYAVTLDVLNESETPAESITDEIKTEKEEHQFFFVVSEGLNLTVAYDDEDGDGNPVGLSNTFTAGDASTGSLTVILKHEPNKTAAGVSDGDPTNAGGETDIETTPAFSVTIQ